MKLTHSKRVSGPKSSGFLRSVGGAVMAVLLIVSSPRVMAQSNLVTWGVNGISTNNPTQALTTGTIATGITASSITRGTGITASGATNSFTSTDWNQTSFGNAIANGDFYTFRINADANYSYSISNFTAALLRSNTGATNVALATSLDAFATAIGSTNVPTSVGTRTFSDSALNNISTSVEFRLAGWNSGGVAGTFRFNATNTSANPFLSGTTTLRSASTLTWDGGQGSGSWTAYNATNSDQANWNGNNTPLNGDSLLFAGTTQTTTTNNVSSLLANAITFSNTAGSFVISGNAMTVSNGIVNLSTSGQTFSNGITLGAAQTFNASAGNLTFAGNLANAGNVLTVDGGNSTAIRSVISGTGGLTKTGAGNLTLNQTNTYTGATTVSQGTLLIDSGGSIASSSLTTVNSGGALMLNGTVGNLSVASGGSLLGSGTVSGSATIAGSLQPGNSPGILNISSDLTLTNGASMVWELFKNVSTQETPAAFDQVLVGGNLLFTGGNSINVNFGSTVDGSSVNWSNAFWENDQSWQIFTVSGSTTGFGNLTLNVNTNDAGGIALSSVREGASFELSQAGSDILLNYKAIPEPSSSMLMVLGTASLIGIRAFRRKQS